MPINPADFTTTIDNPKFPLVPGTTLVYRNPAGAEIIRFQITGETRTVMGVTCVVVHDVVTEDGLLVEDTFDYFAQDTAGNVWYFGEAVRNFVDGHFENTDGSWLAGVNGAEPGIVMKAAPMVGDTYQQENAPGIAEDAATVLNLDTTVSTPYADFSHALQTYEFTALDPSLQEHKFYADGIGFLRVDNLLTGEFEELQHIEFDGTSGADTISGNIGRDFLRGHAGGDHLDGKDGNDVLTGGLGKDYLTGGAGNDTFDFNSLKETRLAGAARDVITDFTRGADKIDLRTIDANSEMSGNQAFKFIGARGFHGEEGELHYRAYAGGVIVEGDVNGDGRADFRIEVEGASSLGKADFIL